MIPSDWQQTLSRKCPGLKRSTSSASSFGSSSSTSSAYSVSEFLQDLEAHQNEETSASSASHYFFSPASDKTSTPLTCNVLHLLKGKKKAKSDHVLVHDVSGVKIYDDEGFGEQTKLKDNNLYENAEFLRVFSDGALSQDSDYEPIFVSSKTLKRW